MNFGHFAVTDGAAGGRWRQGPGLDKEGKGELENESAEPSAATSFFF